jgi:phage tail-like protein
MAQVSNPRKQFNFSIQIAPAPINPFLAQKVESPEITLETAEHGDTNHDIKTAGRVKFGNINISKLQTTSGADNYMFDWLYSCQDVILGGGLVPDDYKRVVTITELAEDGTSVLNTWICMGCFPVKINGQQWDRQSSDNTVEQVELSVDRVEKV